MVSLLSIDTSSSSLSAGSASRGLDLRLCDRATGKRSRCSREIEVSVLLRPDCANAMACGKLRKTFLVCPGAAQRRSILPANRPVRRTRSRYFHPAGRSPPVSLRASSQTPLTAASSSLSSSSVSDFATLANAAPAREPARITLSAASWALHVARWRPSTPARFDAEWESHPAERREVVVFNRRCYENRYSRAFGDVSYA